MPRLKKENSTHHFSNADGLFTLGHLGRSTYVAQLNEAGRAVSQELGMCLLDTAAMATGLTENQRLSDDSHPSHMVWEEMFNLLLNINYYQKKLSV